MIVKLKPKKAEARLKASLNPMVGLIGTESCIGNWRVH